MKVLHGSWTPNAVSDFIQPESFYLWVETPVLKKAALTNNRFIQDICHRMSYRPLSYKNWEVNYAKQKITERISPKYFALPTVNHQPLPSPELIKYLVNYLRLPKGTDLRTPSEVEALRLYCKSA